MMLFSLVLAAAAAAQPPAPLPPPHIEVERAESGAKTPGSPVVITGSAVSETPFPGRKDIRFPGLFVSFEPKARTFWHTHPGGQTLIITKGCGLVQSEGSPAVVVRPGDVVWVPPGVKHWHGATAKSGMTHYAFVEVVDGKAIDVLEPVSENQYRTATLAEANCEPHP